MEHFIKGQRDKSRIEDSSTRSLTANAVDACDIKRVDDINTSIWLS